LESAKRKKMKKVPGRVKEGVNGVLILEEDPVWVTSPPPPLKSFVKLMSR
jgi:hypothetical protein